MWAFVGVFLSVFLQCVSVDAISSTLLKRACSTIEYPTFEQNISWDEVNRRLEIEIVHAEHLEFEYKLALSVWSKFDIRIKMLPALKTLKTYIPYLPTDNSLKKFAYFFFRSVLINRYPIPKSNCASYLGTEFSIPVPQIRYLSKLSSLNKPSYNPRASCDLAQSLGRTATKSIRDQISEVCGKNKQDDLCPLNTIFEITDIFADIFCKLDDASWKAGNKVFNMYRTAVYNIHSFAFNREMPFKYKWNKVISKQNVLDALHYILTELFNDLKNGNIAIRSQVENVSYIIPSKSRLIGGGIAEYPSVEWIVSTGINVLNQIRSFVARYGVGKSRHILKQKSLDTQIDYRNYIQTLKTTQIKKMTDITPARIQSLSNDIGTYFRQVATFEKRKKTADISYLQSTINTYKNAFNNATSKLNDAMVSVNQIYITGAENEVAEDTAKLVILIAEASNPLKWLFGSGNAEKVMDATAALAESSRKLKEALRNVNAYHELINYNSEISKRLWENAGPLKYIGTLLEGIANKSTSTGFGKLQDEFISQYSAYSPAIRKDELTKLTSYWENLIDAICTGVGNTGGVVANAARGVGNTNGKCLEAKRSAAALTVCLEQVHDFQFELITTMASLMHSFVQIESSKVLSSSSTDTLSTKNYDIIVAIIQMSYKLTQASNVEMLCNIMEYQNGGTRPSVCQGGFATIIDVLTSIERPNYNVEEHYVEVPTQRNIPINESLAWFDLGKLYAGETILFQIPNKAWLLKHGWVSAHHIDKALYIKEFSVILPVVSKRLRQIEVSVTPSYVGNKLYDNSDTYYSMSHADTMAYNYIEGHGQHNCAIQPKIPYPYQMDECSQGSHYPTLCRTSRGTTAQIKEVLFPSIYSEFVVKIYGYEDANLDVPATKLGVQIRLTYYFLSGNNRQKQTTSVKKRNEKRQADSLCCTQNSYFNSDTSQCQACPNGTRSFYNGLFCGDRLKLVEVNSEQFNDTYRNAEATCKDLGSTIANDTHISEAIRIGAKTCTCGWVYFYDVLNLADESDNCEVKRNQCTRGDHIRHVFCETKYIP